MRSVRVATRWAACAAAFALPPAPAAFAAERPDACVECHEPPQTALQASVHEKVYCVACHGGNSRPQPNLPEEARKLKAHDPKQQFVAVPDDKCARCHANEVAAWERGAHGLPMKSRPALLCKHCHAKDPAVPSAHAILKLAFESGAVPGRLRTGIDGAFAHRIGLFDAKKKLIDGTTYEPYSPQGTCGKCHDYAAIAMGRHFQAGRAGAEDGRPGEPWILWDADTRTQVPLSYRAWPGACKPADVGLSDWDFALRFGAHHPGGGLLEWMADGRKRDVTEERSADGTRTVSKWKSGGPLAIDCLACHLGTPYNREERALLARAGHFRMAPEAGLGVAAVRPGVKVVTEDGDELVKPAPPPEKPKAAAPAAPPPGGAPAAPAPPAPPASPARPAPPTPRVPGDGLWVAVHDPARFDVEGRVSLDITRHPPARNCLACHATRTPGAGESSAEACDRDIHLAAGMTCTDCHRNGIDHHIARGDGSALDAKHHPDNRTLSCRGCHASGRLGAPAIPHRGLPAFHLDKIACTTCHGGPYPGPATAPVQTARAHGLGLIARDDLDGRDRPAVMATVFKRDDRGLIAPHFAVWPAWWGEVKDGKIVPAPMDRVREAVAAGRQGREPCAEPDTAAVLAKLQELGKTKAVRVAGGRIYRLKGGALVGDEGPEAEAFTWPVAHAVRSAQQALGASGCSDCHASDSPFFFGAVAAVPAGPDGRAVERPMHAYLGMSPLTIHLGAAAVVLRELGMTWIAVLLVLGLLAGTLLHLAAGRRVARLLGVPLTAASGPAPDLGLPLSWVHFCAWGLVLALIVTGAGFLMTYGPTPIQSFFSSRHAVRLHVAAGLAFAAIVPLLALGWIVTDLVRKRGTDWVNAWGGFYWMARGRGDGKALPWDRLWIWVDLLCGLAVAATGLVMAMHVPAVGRFAPAFLHHLADHPLLGPLSYAVHGMAGSALIGRLVMHLYAVIVLRRRA